MRSADLTECKEGGMCITQGEFNLTFEKQVERCALTLKKKEKEYTGENPDRLSAFKVAAAMQGCTPERALAGMMAKHIVSLYDMCYAETKIFDLKIWDEKITDSLNYLFLLRAIVEEGMKHE
jgi:hypothetical protein